MRVLRFAGAFAPNIWMLGGQGATIAAGQNGASLCLDSFYEMHSHTTIREMGMRYSELFRSRIASRKPEFAVAVAGICGPTETEAVEALKSAGSTGFPVGIMKRMFAGSPSMWEEYLNEAAEKWATNKFVVLVASHDLAVRRRSLELLGETLGLGDRQYSESLNPRVDCASAT